MNLAHLLDRIARERSGHPAVQTAAGPVRYDELAHRILRFAGGLEEHGVQPGDRIAVHLQNGVAFVVAVFGALAAGAVATPIDPRAKRREIRHQLADSGARLLLTDGPGAVEALPAAAAAGGVAVRGAPFDAVDGPPRLVERTAADVALQPYTSGTTGVPKGVLLTHGNLVSNVTTLNRLIDVLPDDYRVLVPLPMFHITGMTTMMLAPLCGGGTIFPLEAWDAALMLRLLERHRITVTVCVPTLLVDLLEHVPTPPPDLGALRHFLSGGAPLPVPVAEEFERRLGVPVCEGYGLTETSPVTHANLAAPARRLGSIGWPIDGCEARVVDEARRPLPVGAVGELEVRGPMVMAGYHGRPRETAEVLDADGWFRTGDLARVDAEGYWYIVDRKKDMILTGGRNVYPREVEQVLLEHPAVAACAVVGVPDPRKGETVKAFVVPRAGVQADPGLAEELRAHCLRELSAYKHPRQVEFVRSLPRTASGKVKKTELRGD